MGAHVNPLLPLIALVRWLKGALGCGKLPRAGGGPVEHRIEGELEEVIDAQRRAGRVPMAVLDIDLTLVENAPRTRQIWRLWLDEVAERWAGAEAARARVETMPIVFGVRENLATLGVKDEALAQDGFRFWLKMFFDDELCRLDTPLEGAVQAVRALHEAGVTIAYLTARPAWMREGSVESLSRMGFPMCVPGTILVLKPDANQRDGAYKEEAMTWLDALGGVILAADNEPGHCNAMRRAFGAARVLHVNTRHSPGAPALDPGVDVVGALADGVLTCEGKG